MTDFVYDLLAVDGVKFDSTAVDSVAYNRKDRQLLIEFSGGGSYVYYNVPESVFHVFVDADSLGYFFRRNISGKYLSSKIDREGLKRNPDATFQTKSAEKTHEHFGVKWNADGFPGPFETQVEAADETEALEKFNVAVAGAFGDDVKPVVSAVTHYFE